MLTLWYVPVPVLSHRLGFSWIFLVWSRCDILFWFSSSWRTLDERSRLHDPTPVFTHSHHRCELWITSLDIGDYHPDPSCWIEGCDHYRNLPKNTDNLPKPKLPKTNPNLNHNPNLNPNPNPKSISQSISIFIRNRVQKRKKRKRNTLQYQTSKT